MQKKKGISLIVLVITIIVMIILAGSIILTLSQNGIIGKANEATNTTNLKQVEQAATLAWADAYAGGARTETELETAVTEALKDIDTSKYTITITDKGVTVTIKTGEDDVFVPGLYQTGAIALYEEQGSEAIESMLITSWDDLVASGVVHGGGSFPEKNEYGFYYGISYSAEMSGSTMSMTFNEDGSVVASMAGEVQVLPTGSAVYSSYTIDLSAVNLGVGTISSDGTSIAFVNIGATFILGTNTFVFTNVDLDSNTNSSSAALAGDLILPDNVEIIIEYAFAGCTALTGIAIPSTVSTIGERAFVGCTALSTVHFDEDVSITIIALDTFNGCSSLENIVFPASVEKIWAYSFYGCTNLTSITIPDSVTSIGWYAFVDCPGLTHVIFEGTVAQWNARSLSNVLGSDTPATEVVCSDGTVSLVD